MDKRVGMAPYDLFARILLVMGVFVEVIWRQNGLLLVIGVAMVVFACIIFVVGRSRKKLS